MWFIPEAETQGEGTKELVVELPTTGARHQSGFRGYIAERCRDIVRPIEQRLSDYIQHVDEMKNTVQIIWELCGPDGQLLEQVSEVKSEVKTLTEQSNEMKKDINAQLQDLSTASEENSSCCDKNAAGVKDVSERCTQMEQRMDKERKEMTQTCDCLQQSVQDTQIQLQDLTTTSKERYNEGATRCEKLERRMDELCEDMQMKKAPDLNQTNSMDPGVESQLKWLRSQLDDERNQRKRLEARVAEQEEMIQALKEQVAQQAVEARTMENLGIEQPGQTMDHAQAATARQDELG